MMGRKEGHMKRAGTAVVLVCLLAWGCGRSETKPAQQPPAQQQGSLGQQAGDTAHDTRVLQQATAAANEVIRAAGDCDAVKAALDGAQRALDAAAGEVRTATGRASLETLKRQVQEVAQACP